MAQADTGRSTPAISLHDIDIDELTDLLRLALEQTIRQKARRPLPVPTVCVEVDQ